jgi:phosphate acyltransferase
MSGDLGPRVAISAAQKFLDLHPDVNLLLVGDQLQQYLQKENSRIDFIHASDIVTMDDDPLTALRHKKNSSMWKALEILRDGAADACVSAGNTGALLAISKHLIKTLPGIERPAICKSMPVSTGSTWLLDLGANIDASPEQLHQFAQMGVAVAKAFGKSSPQVSLLNIGFEAYKGTDTLKCAQELLQQDNLINYVGFIEADRIFTGEVDVIVCDGFHGNVALKASEGVAQFITKKIKAAFMRNSFSRFLALLCSPVLKPLRAQLNPAQYNGASFLGLQKTVIKSHGGADEHAFLHALAVAREQVLLGVTERIHHQFSH